MKSVSGKCLMSVGKINLRAVNLERLQAIVTA
jgi:hypothetical protein